MMAAVPPTTPEIPFRQWNFWRRWFGERSEKAAARYVQSLGWRILGVNLADRQGELDILALDGHVLVFIEVRSTSNTDPQTAASTVDLRKQKKLTGAAIRYLGRKKLLGFHYRFDVIAIAWPSGQAKPNLVHIPNAFEPTGRFQFFS